jgi:hypothetical protein
MPVRSVEKWVDMSPLRGAILEALPVCDFDMTFTGPKGEEVPWEVRNRPQVKEGYLMQFASIPGYARVGNIVLLDTRLRDTIPNLVLEQFSPYIAWLWEFKAELAEFSHMQYAPKAMYGLMSLDLKGKHVLDLGCGEGSMGLVAHKRGAARVSSVEIDPGYEGLYQKHLEANKFRPEVFNFISRDLADAETIISKIEGEPDVAVANLGPYYGNADLDAIILAANIPSIRTFIAGAYVKDDDSENSPDTAKLALRTFGFTKNHREIYDKYGCMALMADRK